MGFDVVYSYYERKPDGEYNKDEIKKMKRKVGEPLDDTPLEVLASKILAQLARRDIWVQDVEIFEYKKQKITFKETQGGIVLKNHKFTLDTVSHDLQSKEIPQPGTPQLPAVVPQHLSAGSPLPGSVPQVPAQANGNKAPIVLPADLQGQVPQRVEIFDPEPDVVRAGMVRGKFTTGKRYPIFAEQRDPRESQAGRELPILYVTIDDRGQKVLTPGVAFRPQGGGLVGGVFQSRPVGRNDGLQWDGMQEDQVIDIRRR